jgi:glycosyltransferase involved in cell wall biosynthesis
VKIVFLVSRYAPHAVGGAERVAQTLARSLVGLGHDIVVLTTSIGGDEGERLVDGVRVHAIPLRNVYDFSGPGAASLKPVWHLLDSRNPFMRRAIDRVLADEQPDLIHSHLVTGFSPVAWEVAKARGIRTVHTLHDHFVICARSSMALRGTACRNQHLVCTALAAPRIRSARNVDAVIGVSRYIIEQHRKYGAFMTNPAEVIPNPCHLVGLPSSPRAPISGRSIRLGFLGRLERNKGIDRLLAATRALLPGGWTLDVAGSGDDPFASALRAEYASDLVRFRGRVVPEAFLSEIDLLVAPSTFPETFGMSVAESLALGVPVVASTVGALPELISHGVNGFLVDPFENGALSGLLARIIESRSMIASMADACRASVAGFEPDAVARQHEKLYQRVLTAPS